MSKAHVIRQQAEQFVREYPDLASAIAEVLLEGRTLENGELVGGLTPRLRRVFNFLVSYQRRYGISPSYTEMCDGLSVGRSNLARMLSLLKERGYISYIKNKARSITVLPAGRRTAPSVRLRTPERLAA